MPDGANVLCDLFARFSVATRGCLDEHTVHIAECYGQSVKFQFSLVLHRWLIRFQPQFFSNTLIKHVRAAFSMIGFSANGKHRHSMMNRYKTVQDLANDALCG